MFDPFGVFAVEKDVRALIPYIHRRESVLYERGNRKAYNAVILMKEVV